jgi:hypothetical protein
MFLLYECRCFRHTATSSGFYSSLTAVVWPWGMRSATTILLSDIDSFERHLSDSQRDIFERDWRGTETIKWKYASRPVSTCICVSWCYCTWWATDFPKDKWCVLSYLAITTKDKSSNWKIYMMFNAKATIHTSDTRRKSITPLGGDACNYQSMT